MRMHQTQPSSAFPFEVCLQKKRKTLRKQHLNGLLAMSRLYQIHLHCKRDSFNLSCRMIVVHSWTFWALLWKSENAYGKQAGLGVYNDQWSKHLDVVKKGGEMFADVTDGWLSILPTGEGRPTWTHIPRTASVCPSGSAKKFFLVVCYDMHFHKGISHQSKSL